MTIPSCGIVTLARVGSTRLPAKVLREIAGRSVLAHHLERLAGAELPMVVATTAEPGAERIQEISETCGVPFFVGDTKDVLARTSACARQHGFEVVVRVSASNPLIDGALIREGLADFLMRDDPDLVLTSALAPGYPPGFEFEICTIDTLREALRGAVEHDELIMNPQSAWNPALRLASYGREPDASKFRLCLETGDDLRLLKTLFEDHAARELDCEGIIALLERHPELVEINAHVQERRPSPPEEATPKMRCLHAQRAESDGYALLPLRKCELAKVLCWRARGGHPFPLLKTPLRDTRAADLWERVLRPSFDAVRPRDLFFAIRAGHGSESVLIGCAALTQMDWDAARAEVTLLHDPERRADPARYARDLAHSLTLLQRVAFADLALHRLSVESFEGEVTAALAEAGFEPEGTLREHVYDEGRYRDVLLHGCLRGSSPTE